MDERTYTLGEIKTAFRSQFHGAGELWFPVDEVDEYSPTEGYWEEFLEKLEHPEVL